MLIMVIGQGWPNGGAAAGRSPGKISEFRETVGAGLENSANYPARGFLPGRYGIPGIFLALSPAPAIKPELPVTADEIFENRTLLPRRMTFRNRNSRTLV